MKPYDFVVFDCDGVILQSNQVKSNAFAAALTGEPQSAIDAFVAYHKANGGISRYKKFAHYFEHMQPCQDAVPYIAQALERYAAIVQAELLTCPLIPGIEQYLQQLQQAGIRCAVNSGGDEQELHGVFAARKLAEYFQHIFGSPTGKQENMQRLKNLGFMQGNGVMFGDSKSDWLAAQAFGLDFVFITHETEWHDEKPNNMHTLQSFLNINC
ncbi:MAG: HAD hydrolase-like protein [Pseudomonadota bacterium]|nr:HAD hydrolase-like protein [Pseudomonadota bacterium]